MMVSAVQETGCIQFFRPEDWLQKLRTLSVRTSTGFGKLETEFPEDRSQTGVWERGERGERLRPQERTWSRTLDLSLSLNPLPNPPPNSTASCRVGSYVALDESHPAVLFLCKLLCKTHT